MSEVWSECEQTNRKNPAPARYRDWRARRDCHALTLHFAMKISRSGTRKSLVTDA
jgi:hypothetical protein